MFCFLLRSNNTFRLNNNPHPLKSFPILCSSGSKIYPHIISEVSQVIPQIISLNDKLNSVPLFVAGKINKDNTLSLLDLEINKNTPFCLVFYPDIQESTEPIIKEYWKSIKPMLICRDMGGYYLGLTSDPNIVIFEQCNLNEAECSLNKLKSGYNENTMQIEGTPTFNEISIYIRKKIL
jgi:hypothetical protein